MTESIAQWINCLAKFCGKQDISKLTSASLEEAYQISQVDTVVLFGGSILAGVDVLASCMQQNMAKHYIIVGGYGHTSKSLFEAADRLYPDITKNKDAEAKVFSEVLSRKYNLTPHFIETKSTNCGNNITNLLTLLSKNRIPMNSLLMIQDATMQLRMDVTLQKYASKEMTIINFPAYQATVLQKDDHLFYQEPILGMWDMERYISLLLGEIPRIRDDQHGYGPKGKNFLCHVDVPSNVIDAFNALREYYPDLIRKANPNYASF